jgi:hypothetical protein
MALGQITEAGLEDGLGGHATKVWTDEFDFAGTSQWHIDIAHAPGWGTKFWNIVMGATALFWWLAYLPHRVGRSMRQTTPPRAGDVRWSRKGRIRQGLAP